MGVVPWYYAPIIFLGGLLIVLLALVFLHWLAQFWMDSQERDDVDDILDSDVEEYTSSYNAHVRQQSNYLKRKKYQKLSQKEKNLSLNRPLLVDSERQGSVKPGSMKQGTMKHGSMKQGSVRQDSVGQGSVRQGSERGGSKKSSPSDYKEKTRRRLAVSLSVKHSRKDLRISGMIKGVIGILFPDNGGPDKIRFKLNLQPRRRKRTYRTPLYIPLEASLLIPFRMGMISKEELKTAVLHLRLFGKKLTFGLPFGREHCYGEAFISLAELFNMDEINIVQEIIPLGIKPFHRKSIKIRVADPKIRVREVASQLDVRSIRSLSEVSLATSLDNPSMYEDSKDPQSPQLGIRAVPGQLQQVSHNPVSDLGSFKGSNLGSFHDSNPGWFHGSNPSSFHGSNPGSFHGSNPDLNSGSFRGSNPGLNSGSFRGSNPGLNSGSFRGSNPGLNSGSFRGSNPGLNSGSFRVSNPGSINEEAIQTAERNNEDRDCVEMFNHSSN